MYAAVPYVDHLVHFKCAIMKDNMEPMLTTCLFHICSENVIMTLLLSYCSTLQSPPDGYHRLDILDCYYLLLLIIIFKFSILCF